MTTRHNVSKRPQGLFSVVMAEAAVGDEVIYHVGPHAAGPHKKEAFITYSDGKCTLYQRRVGDGLFEYIAQKRGAK
jgi:hypothetical protein